MTQRDEMQLEEMLIEPTEDWLEEAAAYKRAFEDHAETTDIPQIMRQTIPLTISKAAVKTTVKAAVNTATLHPA